MESRTVTINIAGRPYSLKTNASEGGIIEEAAGRIAASLDSYSVRYTIRDTQDLMAMVLLQHTVDMLRKDEEIGLVSEGIEGQTSILHAILLADSDRQSVL